MKLECEYNNYTDPEKVSIIYEVKNHEIKTGKSI